MEKENGAGLTEIQRFILDHIEAMGTTLHPAYLSGQFYESKGQRAQGGSRWEFGQNAAGYRACRALAAKGLIKEHRSEDPATKYVSYHYSPIWHE